MEDKGTVSTNEDLNDWVFVEAECSDVDESFEELFDKSSTSDLSDFVDHAAVSDCQGISLQLFRQQEFAETEEQLMHLKRKYIHSPEQKAVVDLSPRLESISLSPRRGKKAKKQLFGTKDSDEVDNTVTQRLSEVDVRVRGENGVEALLSSKNQRAFAYAKFKANFGISFSELVRNFKCDKTCSLDWVVCGLYLNDSRAEAAKTVLQDYCNYIYFAQMGSCTLMLLNFKTQKCRETLLKLLKTLLKLETCQILAEPPRARSAACALYWYNRGLANGAFTFGSLPDWIAKQTLLSHHLASEKPFDLSTMIQWAYDNEAFEESEIAYQYALQAETDENAAAFLNSNNQAKHVKDCATMCRYYRKAEMQRMTMSDWIFKMSKGFEDSESWKEIVKFLRYQCIEFISFLAVFKRFLRGVPKKNCLVIWGPPNTGKSMFCMSLLSFLKGKVISYVNSKSQFWLQPLSDAKIGLLDDATKPCWDYFDIFMRNALDGNTISIDCKHKAPLQLKCPPLLITTNINLMGDERWKYLRSRVSCFCFATEFPLKEDGAPGYTLNDKSWASFFKRFWKHLELSDQEEEGEDGDSQRALRLCTRSTPHTV
ncbi:E1 [Ailuropoda melanoleuca papillomavirus 4]|uniref:Replication protein E1 n=1 Tax=Ailuropoda melanoleuca papillomavirus 4 TaxID=2016453 RepID=A0A220IGF9_9PAPI|nr:E1 [Ailuropoda melanoleuca papillomavirus 4]ASH99071.1 E1 [Ailuropoda melanoleuca papillomavirus 4]